MLIRNLLIFSTFMCGQLLAQFGGTTIEVVNTKDSGSGSLREAIDVYLVGGGEVHFNESLDGATITLGSPINTEWRLVNIDASNLPNGITISGNNQNGIFIVENALYLTNVRLTRGRSEFGGAIDSLEGNIYLNNCTIDNCTADSEGGAIFSGGKLIMNNTTLYNNTAIGILTDPNSGAIFSGGRTELQHCTITGNSGGIFLFSDTGEETVLRNTVIAGNTNADVHYEGFDFPSENFFTSAGNNFIGTGNAVDGATFIVAGDVTGIPDPKLGALGDNGGGTPTCRPLGGSPLIDAASGEESGEVFWTNLLEDQRGGFRKVGNHPDIGAVEVGINVQVSNNADSGPGSLRQVMADAPDGATIGFDASLSGATIFLESGWLEIDGKSLTIDGSSLAKSVSISGSRKSIVFLVSENAGAVFRNLSIMDGRASVNGGGINNEGRIKVENCTISNCIAIDPIINYDAGGGIFNGGFAELVHCTLYGNEAGSFPGAILSSGNMSIHHCTITGNGSGVQNYDGSMTIRNSVIAGNNGGDFGNTQYASLTSRGNNIVGSGSIEEFDHDGDLTGIADPLLAPLYDNGGKTRTCFPLPGSPVIDAVTNHYGSFFWNLPIPQKDQRDRTRPVGAFADSGSVEVQPGEVSAKALVLEIDELTMSESHGELTATVLRTSGSGDLIVSLDNPDPGELSIPGSVTIPNGANSASFTIRPVDDSLEDGDQTVLLTAAASGYLSGSDTVTVVDDEQYVLVTNVNNDGPGSLRQAFEDVKRFWRIRFDPLLDGAEIVLFQTVSFPDGSGTEPSNSALTAAFTDFIIDASDLPSGLTISANLAQDVLYFIYCRMELRGLTIRAADMQGEYRSFSGGGISAWGAEMFIDDLAITRNVVDTTDSNAVHGIGIWSRESEWYIRNSTISNHPYGLDGRFREPARGAGIQASSSYFELDGVTISGNSAEEGAAIYGPGSSFKIVNSTISENTSLQSGSIIEVGSLHMTHSTVSGNGAGDAVKAGSGDTVEIGNSIVAGNSGDDITQEPNGQVTSLGYNLAGFGSGVAAFTASGDQSGVGDPLLGPLGDNGGPTPTMGLLPGSPALDAGFHLNGTAVDQRGQPRPVGPGVDIGAFELQPGEVVWDGTFRLAVGQYAYDSLLSWTYGNTPELGHSQMLGWVYVPLHPDAIYAYKLGWLLAPSGTAATGIYFYRYNTGNWIWISESYGGYYWDYAANAWGSVFQ